DGDPTVPRNHTRFGRARQQQPLTQSPFARRRHRLCRPRSLRQRERLARNQAMYPLYQRYMPTIARLLMCVIFLLSGFTKVTNFAGNEGYMQAHGMTTATGLLLVLAIFAEIGGGLALFVGFRVRPVAVLLFLYLIPATLIFHNFWAESDP